MKGDTIILPITGTLRTHFFKPAAYRDTSKPTDQPPRRQVRKVREVVPGSWRAQILELLRANPDGLCVVDFCTAIGMDVDQCAAKMITMCLSGEIAKDGKRLIGKRERFVYKLGRGK